ncbi:MULTISPECIES: type II toxin-antitoxin system VapC family toxin [unclassified Luteococcus]|uniref:type II toxin-antitoxin system VapC family toxin n=1 Tax=unclassified Luteococcus TaxID=2639923 RepID=UPI00313BA3FB
MIIDSSALVSILTGEPTAERLLDAIQQADRLAISAATLVETSIVLEAKQGRDAVDDLHQLLADLDCEVTAFDEEQALLAAQAWRRFGKGRHPAALNLGDCYSYACAKGSRESLLFVGEDFSQTDIRAAIWDGEPTQRD